MLILTSNYLFSQGFNIEWQACFGGSDTEYPRDIIQVSDSYLITGYTKSNNGSISYNHGSTDVWVFKLSWDGIMLSEKTYGGSTGDVARKLISDSNGHIYYLSKRSLWWRHIL